MILIILNCGNSQIARNLLSGEGFSYIAITKSVPSAYMPPGLPYLYYFIFTFTGDNSAGYFAILALNAVLSALSVLLIYRFCLTIFDKKVSLYCAVYTAFSPVLIYSSVSFTPIIIYQVLLLFVLFMINEIAGSNAHTKAGTGITGKEKTNYRNAALLGVALGLFLYFRAESLIFIAFTFLYFLITKKTGSALIILFISLLIISPVDIQEL